MAITVPVLEAPRLDTRSLPTPFERNSYSPDEFAGSVVARAAGSLEQTGQRVQAVLEKAKAEADQQATMEAVNKFRQFTAAGMETVRRAEGKNAAHAAQSYYDSIDEEAKRIFGGLANEQQRRAFSAAADEELLQSHKIAEAHVGQQIEVAREQTFQATLALSVENATSNVDVRGVGEMEAANTVKAIDAYAAARGMSREAADAMKAKQLGILYSAQVRTLLGRNRAGDVEAAAAIIRAHERELVDSPELIGRVEHLQRASAADGEAQRLAARFHFANGALDDQRAIAEIDRLYAPGEMRDAVKAAWRVRSDDARRAVAGMEDQSWQNLLNAWQTAGRSLAATQATDAWKQATPAQRENLINRAQAEERERAGDPLTREQVLALTDLEVDFANRADFWGTADVAQLDKDPRYNMLPERVRVGLGSHFAQLHADRNNPEALLRSAGETLLQQAQAPGHPLEHTKGKPVKDWDYEDVLRFQSIQDGVRIKVQEWKANHPKIDRVPNAVIRTFVDQVTREGHVPGDRKWYLPSSWLFPGTETMTAEEARRRTPEEQVRRPFTPTLSDEEDTLGREVQLRRGYDPDRDEGKFSPEALAQAAADYREITSSGPPPQKRAEYEAKIKAAGKTLPPGITLDDVVQQMWEAEALRYP